MLGTKIKQIITFIKFKFSLFLLHEILVVIIITHINMYISVIDCVFKNK